MKWLEQAPRANTAASFGRPWSEGELAPDHVGNLRLANAALVHEARPLAFWPDGSVKWTAHAVVVPAGTEAGGLEPVLAPDLETVPAPGRAAAALVPRLLATQEGGAIRVDTGAFAVTVPGLAGNTGEALTGPFIAPDGSQLGDALRLVVSAPDVEVSVESAGIETPGAVRTVLRIEGSVTAGGTELLRFIIRLTFFAGQPTVQVTQTLLFQDAAKDRIIKGLGLRLDRSLSGDLLNRRVSIAGDTAVYTEPVQSLYTRPFSGDNPDYARQLAGDAVEESADTAALFAVGRQNAVWSAFRVTQESEDYFRLEKQTAAKLLPVRMGKGHRSKGLLYAGDTTGGVAVTLRGFWQKFPAALEVDGMAGDTASFTAWSWAESVEPMDLRHYSDECYVPSAYEGFDELRSTPEGVANTSHISFDFVDNSPSNGWLWELACERQEPAQPVCSPELYYSSRAAGTTWGLPETVQAGAAVEQRLDGLVDFYTQEVEQRGWYGYWNFGDFMHSYDQYRHQWRYDLGGFAWANNELAPNMWLWQSFLRTGDARAFRLAEAMTWHSAEVDRHHFGEYSQLGSRHNVVHWGCGCKEVRISMAGLHRYYYFLTGDERIGELLSEVRDAEHALDRLDPMREFYERTPERTHIRIGPDWSALVSNWFSEYERTGDAQWKDRITKGISQLEAMPHGLLSGPTVEFDARALDLHHMFTGTEGGFHMIIAFGSPQVWMEVAEALDHEGFRRMLADFGRFYALPEEEKQRLTGGALDDSHFSWPSMATGMMAYGAWYYRDEELAAKAWDILLENAGGGLSAPFAESLQHAQTWQPVVEHPAISTNWASQWALNATLCLELIGPPGNPRWADRPRNLTRTAN
ncbi:hypothetical protein [Pseudarthrobacter sp. DSP2-3-2b1]|uniref:exo-rhamnogalacturonan lyase family protein n=1 Tax=Pseudarthrobacter sp. DSP2-3-2b1 TaxID=2804661 RepID=UPI003CF1DE2C